MLPHVATEIAELSNKGQFMMVFMIQLSADPFSGPNCIWKDDMKGFSDRSSLYSGLPWQLCDQSYCFGSHDAVQRSSTEP